MTAEDKMIDETCLIPEFVAENIVKEAMDIYNKRERSNVELNWEEAGSWLAKRAYHIYEVNKNFNKKLKGARGRDFLYMFMRHWMASWMYTNGVNRFDIPHAFCNGLPVKN